MSVPNPNGGLFSVLYCNSAMAKNFADVIAEWMQHIEDLVAINNAWDNPVILEGTWGNGMSIDPVTLLPDMDFWLLPKHKPANDDKEAVVVVYSARIIVEHGGYFCATQIRARNTNKGTQYNDTWTQYQLPDGDMGKTCFWLCEPGYSGDGCNLGRATSPDSCVYINLTPDYLKQFITYNESGGNDNSSIEESMRNTLGFFQHSKSCYSNRCEHDVILAAKSYLENGHGIIASPATVTAHSVYGAWSEDDYTYMENQKYYYSNAQVNLQVTDNKGNYTTKTLCMPGFDGPNCTTDLCTECTDPTTMFNSQTGDCTDCIDEYVHDESGKCVPCPEGSYKHPTRDECITCDNTEYYSNGLCLKKTAISRTKMYNCFPNSNASDFQACVFDTCENGKTVSCVTSDGRLGTKTCNARKWSRCALKGEKNTGNRAETRAPMRGSDGTYN